MKTEKIKKVRGSVLFTVVAVMTLLVVFMAGTMILVASANHRSHINYSSAQTTVTSRTVAESTLKALTLSPKNEDYEDYFFSVTKDNPRIEIPVSFAASDASAALGTMGDIDNVVVTYEGTMNFYSDGTGVDDGAEKGWKERDIIKVTSNVNLGRSNSSTSIYLVVDPPNGDPGGGGGGAGFVTTGGANFDCQTGLYGGAYINLPELDDAKKYDYDDPTSYRSGYTMTLVNSGSIAEADAVFNGNLSLGNSNGFIFPAKGKGITVWGDMKFNSNDHFKAFVNTNNVSGTLNFNEIPYIYVDGKLSSDDQNAKPQIAMANIEGGPADNVPLNIFCGTLDIPKSNEFTMKADIFCMDAGATSTVGSTSATKLQSWTNSVINKCISTDATSYVAGNVFSKGNFKFVTAQEWNDIIIDGDLRIEGDLDLSEMKNNTKLKVGGDLVVGGNLIGVTNNKLNVGGSIYSNSTIEGLDKSLKDGVEIRKELDETLYKKVENYSAAWQRMELRDGETMDLVSHKYVCTKDPYYGFWITYYNAAGEEGNKYQVNGDHVWIAADVKSDFAVQPGWTTAVTGENINFDGAENYYIACDKMGNVPLDADGFSIGETRTTEKEWYYRTDDMSDPPVHYTYDDAVETKYYDTKEGKYIDESAAYGGDLKELASYKYSKIYPAYAEKNVLLGLESVKGASGADLPKSESQVVMTMQEVLENVVNPYETKGYPSQFEKLVGADAEEGALPEYHNYSEIYNSNLTVCKTNIDALNTIPVAKVVYEDNQTPLPEASMLDAGTVESTVKGTVVLDHSCILKDFTVGQDKYDSVETNKGIVLNPKNGDMIVVIDGDTTLANGHTFYIDDVSTNNSVYFYIKKDNKLNFTTTGTITSIKYSALINSGTDFQIVTDNSLAKKDAEGKPDPKTLKDLGYNNPNVFVYGDEGSELNLVNFTNFVGNIVSPDMSVNCTSTNGSGVSNTIYYNGTDISKVDAEGKWLMFGCCNSEETNFPNKIKMLYTPDTGDTDKVYDTEDRSHWLKVLYYDEY